MSALVKICGITTRDQFAEVAALGANFIGINLWPKSKRHLPLTQAVEWKDSFPETVKFVALMVNPTPDEVAAAHESGIFSLIQLHGDETAEFCEHIRQRGLRVLKAFQVRDEASLDRIADFAVDDILLDAYHPQERGGSGLTFPWELALRFKEKFPHKNLWLAGGLTPENVAEAVRIIQPHAVDVASGVEDGTPGVKNLDKVARFITGAKDADH